MEDADPSRMEKRNRPEESVREQSDPRSKVMRTEGESRGQINRDVDMDVGEVEWMSEMDNVREDRVPLIRLKDGKIRRGLIACEAQAIGGGYYLWDKEIRPTDAKLLERVKVSGGGQVRIGNRRLWSNSRVILDRIKE